MSVTPRRRTRRALLVVAAIACVATACVPPTRPSTARTVTPLPSECPPGGGPAVPPTSVAVGGRSTRLLAPAGYQPGVSYPLLVSLHPFVLDQEGWESYSGLGAAARQRGYWVLTPRGSDPGPRWAVPGGLELGPDDIGYLDALIRTTATNVCVDGDRVFAAGFSAGAAMAVGSSCELQGRFRAIAGSGGTNLTSLCPTSEGVDALILHGDQDGFAPLSGSEVPFAPPLGLPVADVVASFATRNGCAPNPTAIALTATVTVDRYSCSGHRLEFFLMRGAGHAWAGSLFPLDIVTGPTDRTFSATNAVLDFFGAE